MNPTKNRGFHKDVCCIIIKHTYKAKDRVTQTPLKTVVSTKMSVVLL